jgi:hypothetical protein
VAFTERGVDRIEKRCGAIADVQARRLERLVQLETVSRSRGRRRGEEGRRRTLAQEEEELTQRMDAEEREEREEETRRKRATLEDIEGQIAEKREKTEEEVAEELRKEAVEKAYRTAREQSVHDEAELRIRAR